MKPHRLRAIRKIKAARALADMRQSDLAHLSGVGQAILADIESGRRKATFQMLRRLVRALKEAGVTFHRAGVSIDWR